MHIKKTKYKQPKITDSRTKDQINNQVGLKSNNLVVASGKTILNNGKNIMDARSSVKFYASENIIKDHINSKLGVPVSGNVNVGANESSKNIVSISRNSVKPLPDSLTSDLNKKKLKIADPVTKGHLNSLVGLKSENLEVFSGNSSLQQYNYNLGLTMEGEDVNLLLRPPLVPQIADAISIDQINAQLGVKYNNIPVFSGNQGVGAIILHPVGSSPNVNGATAVNAVLTLQPASSAFPGVVTAGAQTFGGVKTFASSIIINSTTVSAPGSSVTLTLPSFTDTLVGRDTVDTLTNKTLSNATLVNPNIPSVTLSNATLINSTFTNPTITGFLFSNITLTNPTFNDPNIVGTLSTDVVESAGTTLDVGASTGTQIVNIATSTGAQTVNIGTGSGTTAINIGNSGDTVTVNATELAIGDKLITLNSSASGLGTARSAGFQIRDNNDDTISYIKTGTSGDNYLIKAPENSFILNTPVLTADDTLVGKNTIDVLTNKTLTTPTIVSIASTSGIIAIPAGPDTLIGRSTIDTLTNKTLTTPTILTIAGASGLLTLPTGPSTIVGRATIDTLTNKTLTTPTIASIVNTGLLSLPTGVDTLVGRGTIDTLTNKTLTTPTITSIASVSGLITMPNGPDTLVARTTVETLTNKTLTTPTIVSLVNTGLLDLPVGTDTIVARTTVDTLTNKTLTSPTITSPVISNLNASQVVVTDASKILASSIGASNSLLFTNPSGVLTWIGNTLLTSNNTVYGVTAGSTAIFSGTSNLTTLIGYGAGSVLSATTFNNTFVGSVAGSTKTTGDGNTFIGAESGYLSTTGASNTYVGYAAGRGQTSSSDNEENTALGRGALSGISTGDNNTALGFNGGNSITSGSNNTFLGHTSNATSGTLTNAMALGYQASVDQDNTVVMGNSSVILIRGDSVGLCDLGTSAKQFGTVYSNAIDLKNSRIVTNSSGATLTLPSVTDTLIGRNTTDTLTNKTLTTPTIASIVNTGLLTLPPGTDTLVGRNTTDTLTNKTLTTPIISDVTSNTIPSAPSAGVKLYSQFRTGRYMLSQVTATDFGYMYQPSIFANKVHLWSAPGNSTSATQINFSMTNSGQSTSARNISTTTFFTQLKRIGYISGTPANSTPAGIRQANLLWYTGNATNTGGFFFMCRFGLSSATTNATQATFVGFTASTSEPLSSTNPSTLTDILGFGVDGTDTTWTFMHNDSTGTATKDALTGTFPPRSLSADVFEARIFCVPNTTTIYYSLEVLNGGSFFEGSTSTDIPSNTTLLAPHVWTSNNGTAVTTAIDIMVLYIETPY